MTIDAAAALPPGRRMLAGNFLPVGIVVAVIVVIWYIAALPMNAVVAAPKIDAGAGVLDAARISWSLDRPVLPAPHQVLAELFTTVFTVAPTVPKSLLFHAWVTLSSTVVGFLMGTILGVLLAVAIVHVTTLNKSLMPWIIASQTIPILAVAPMVIVVLGSVGFVGLLPKSIISTYLCFFPVTIGMVKGLTSPDRMLIDLMRTYNANSAQVLWKLRWPASLPFLFASLKVAIAIALVGAIVGELPTGAQAGIGARLLTGSYYGQTIQIWAALFVAAIMAAALVSGVGAAERVAARRMGGER
ncbi:MAG: ABC transporter permease [Pseudomonadota bacterium]|nr:ABC transporter permease [Pseudomonadota bacterium]